jgi:hypothetical protein
LVINRQNGHFFIENEPMAAILNFRFSSNSFQRHPLTYTNPYAKKKNPSTFATCRVRTIKVYRRGGGSGCGGGRGSGTTTKP